MDSRNSLGGKTFSKSRKTLLRILILPMFFMNQSNAKINIWLGTGFACGGMPLNPCKNQYKTEFLEYLILQVPNINLAFQLEHQFSEKMIYGLNFHLTFVPIFSQYRFITIGAFFGGIIASSDTKTCIMKGGINYVLFSNSKFSNNNTQKHMFGYDLLGFIRQPNNTTGNGVYPCIEWQ